MPIDEALPSARSVVWSPEERVFKRSERRVLTERDIEDIVAFLNSLSSQSLVAKAKDSPKS